MIDYAALFKISYGLYVVCSGNMERGNGFVSNTVFQVTAEPPRFAICCNKNNFSAQLIAESMAFSVTVLDQNVHQDIISRFGYKSGRNFNKLEGMTLTEGETGVPILLNDALAYLECKVIHTIDLGTHLMFVGDLMQSVLVDENKEPLTYNYYHKVKKGLSPKNAPTYIDPEKLMDRGQKSSLKKFKCAVCGYIYDEATEDLPFSELPDDWVCPLCGTGKEDFIELLT